MGSLDAVQTLKKGHFQDGIAGAVDRFDDPAMSVAKLCDF
jgi:hypothetical protein